MEGIGTGIPEGGGGVGALVIAPRVGAFGAEGGADVKLCVGAGAVCLVGGKWEGAGTGAGSFLRPSERAEPCASGSNGL